MTSSSKPDQLRELEFAKQLYTAKGPNLGWRSNLTQDMRMPTEIKETEAIKDAVANLLADNTDNTDKTDLFEAVYTQLTKEPRTVPRHAQYQWFHAPMDVELTENAENASCNGNLNEQHHTPVPVPVGIQRMTDDITSSTLRLKRPVVGKTTYTTLDPVVALERKQVALERAQQQTADVEYATQLIHDTNHVSIANYLCNLSMDLAMRSEALLEEECDTFGATALTLPTFGFRDESARTADVPNTFRTRMQLSGDNTLTLALQTIDDVMLWASVDGERLRRLMDVLATKSQHMKLQEVDALSVVARFRPPLRLDSVTHVPIAKDVTLPLTTIRNLLKDGLKLDLAMAPNMITSQEMELEFAYDLETRMLAVSRFTKQLDPTSLSLHGLNHLSGETHERMVFEGMRDSIGCPLVHDALPVVEHSVSTNSGLPDMFDHVEYSKTYALKSQELIETCWRLRHRLLAWTTACDDRPLYRGARDMLTQAARLVDGADLKEIDPLHTLLEQAVLHASAAFAGLTSERLPPRLLELGDEALANLELFLGLMASLDYGLGQGCGVSSCRGQTSLIVPAIKAAGVPLAAAIVKGPRRLPLAALNKELEATALVEIQLAEGPLLTGDLEAAREAEINLHARRAGIATELAMRFVDADHKSCQASTRAPIPSRSSLLADENAFEWLGARMMSHDMLGSVSARALQASERLWDSSRLLSSYEQRDLVLHDPKVQRSSPDLSRPEVGSPSSDPRQRTDPLAERPMDDFTYSRRREYVSCAVDNTMQTTPTSLLQRALQTLISFELHLTSLRSHLAAGAYDGWQLRETIKVSSASLQDMQAQYIDHMRQVLQRNRPLIQTLTRLCAQVQHAYTQSLGLWRLSSTERDAYLQNATRVALEGAKLMAHIATIFTTDDIHLSMPELDPAFAEYADVLDVGKALYDTPTLLRMLDPVPYRSSRSHRHGVNFDRMIQRKLGHVDVVEDTRTRLFWSRREAYARGLQAAHVLISYATTHLFQPIERLELARRFNVLMPSLWKALPADDDPTNEQGALETIMRAFATSVQTLFDGCDRALFETDAHGMLLRICQHVGCLPMSDAAYLHELDAAGRARKQLWSLLTQVHLGDALVQHTEYERLFPSSAYNMIPPFSTSPEGPSFSRPYRPYTPMSSSSSDELLRVAGAAGALATLLVAPIDHWMPSTVDTILMRPHARRDAIYRIVCATPSVQDVKRAFADPARVLRNRTASDDASFAPALTVQDDPSGAKMRSERDADGMPTRKDELRVGLMSVRPSLTDDSPFKSTFDADEAVHQALLHCDKEAMRPITRFNIVGWYCFDEDDSMEETAKKSTPTSTLSLFPELGTDLNTLGDVSDILLLCNEESSDCFVNSPKSFSPAERQRLRQEGFLRNGRGTMWVQVDHLERLQAVFSQNTLSASAFSPLLVTTQEELPFSTDDVLVDVCQSPLTMHQVAASFKQVHLQMRYAWIEAIPTSLFASALVSSVQARRVNDMVDEAYSRMAMPLAWLRAKGAGDMLISFGDAYNREKGHDDIVLQYTTDMVANALNIMLFHDVEDVPNSTLVERRRSQFESTRPKLPSDHPLNEEAFGDKDAEVFSALGTNKFLVDAHISPYILDELHPAPRPIGALHTELKRTLRQVIRNTSRLVTMGLLLMRTETHASVPGYMIDGMFCSYLMQLVIKFQVARARQEVVMNVDNPPAQVDPGAGNVTLENVWNNAGDLATLQQRLRERLASRLLQSTTTFGLPVLTFAALLLRNHGDAVANNLFEGYTAQAAFVVLPIMYFSMLNDELYSTTIDNALPCEPEWGMLQAATRALLPVSVGVNTPTSFQRLTLTHTRVFFTATVFAANAAAVVISTVTHGSAGNYAKMLSTLGTLGTLGGLFLGRQFGFEKWDFLSQLQSVGSMQDTQSPDDVYKYLVLDSGRTAWLSTATGSLYARPVLKDLLNLEGNVSPYTLDLVEGALVGAMEAMMWTGGQSVLYKPDDAMLQSHAIPLALGVLSLASPSAAIGAVVSSYIQPEMVFNEASNAELRVNAQTQNWMKSILAGAAAAGVTEAVDLVVDVDMGVWAERLFQQVSNSLTTITLLLIHAKTTKDPEDVSASGIEHDDTALLAMAATFTMATQLFARRRHAPAGRLRRFDNQMLQFGLRVFTLAVTMAWWHLKEPAQVPTGTAGGNATDNAVNNAGSGVLNIGAPATTALEFDANSKNASSAFMQRLDGIHLQRKLTLHAVEDNGDAARAAHHCNRIPQARWKLQKKPTLPIEVDTPTEAMDEVSIGSIGIPISGGSVKGFGSAGDVVEAPEQKTLDIDMLCDPETALKTLQTGLVNQPVSAALWSTQVNLFGNDAAATLTYKDWLTKITVMKTSSTPLVLNFRGPDAIKQARAELKPVGFNLLVDSPKNQCKLIRLYEACHGKRYGLLYHALNVTKISNLIEYENLRKMVYSECEDNMTNVNNSQIELDQVYSALETMLKYVTTKGDVKRDEQLNQLKTLVGVPNPVREEGRLSIAAALPLLNKRKCGSMQPHLLHTLIYDAAWAYREALEQADLRLLPNLRVDDILSGNEMRIQARNNLISSVEGALMVATTVDPLTKQVVAVARFARAAAACEVLHQTRSKVAVQQEYGQGGLKLTMNGDLLNSWNALSQFRNRMTHLFALNESSDILSWRTAPNPLEPLDPLINARYASNDKHAAQEPEKKLLDRPLSVYRVSSTSSLQGGTEMLLASCAQKTLAPIDSKAASYDEWHEALRPVEGNKDNPFLLRNAFATAPNQVDTEHAWAQKDTDMVSAAHLPNSGGSYAHVVLAHSLKSIAMAHTLHRQQTAGEVNVSRISSGTSLNSMREYDTMVRLMATRPLDRGKVETDVLRSLAMMSETTGLTVQAIKRVADLQSLSGFGVLNLMMYMVRILMFMTDTRSTRVILHDIERDGSIVDDQKCKRIGLMLLNGLSRCAWSLFASKSSIALYGALTMLLWDVSSEIYTICGENRQARALVESTELAYLSTLTTLGVNTKLMMRNAFRVNVFRRACHLWPDQKAVQRLERSFPNALHNGLLSSAAVITMAMFQIWAFSTSITATSDMVGQESRTRLNQLFNLVLASGETSFDDTFWQVLMSGNHSDILLNNLHNLNPFRTEASSLILPLNGAMTVAQTSLTSLLQRFTSKAVESIMQSMVGGAQQVVDGSQVHNDATTAPSAPAPTPAPILGPTPESTLSSKQLKERLFEAIFDASQVEMEQQWIQKLFTQDYEKLHDDLKHTVQNKLKSFKTGVDKARAAKEQTLSVKFQSILDHLKEMDKSLDRLRRLRRVINLAVRVPFQNVPCEATSSLDVHTKKLLQISNNLEIHFKTLKEKLSESLTPEQQTQLLNTWSIEFDITGSDPQLSGPLGQLNRYLGVRSTAIRGLESGVNGNQWHAAHIKINPQSPQQLGALLNLQHWNMRSTIVLDRNKLQLMAGALFKGVNSNLNLFSQSNNILDKLYLRSERDRKINRENKSPKDRPLLSDMAFVQTTMSTNWYPSDKDSFPRALVGDDYEQSKTSLVQMPFLLDMPLSGENLPYVYREAFLPLVHPNLDQLQPEGLYIEVINQLLYTFKHLGTQEETNATKLLYAVNAVLAEENARVAQTIGAVRELHTALTNFKPGQTELLEILQTSALMKVYEAPTAVLGETVPMAARIGEIVALLTQTLLYIGAGSTGNKQNIHEAILSALHIAFPGDSFFHDLVDDWQSYGTSTMLQLPDRLSSSLALNLLKPSQNVHQTVVDLHTYGWLTEDVPGVYDASLNRLVKKVDDVTEVSIRHATLYELDKQLVLTSPAFGRMLSAAVGQAAARSQAQTSISTQPVPSNSNGIQEQFRTPLQRQEAMQNMDNFLTTCLAGALETYKNATPLQPTSLTDASSNASDASDASEPKSVLLAMQIMNSTAALMSDTTPDQKGVGEALDKVITACNERATLGMSDAAPDVAQFTFMQPESVLRAGYSNATMQVVEQLTNSVQRTTNTPNSIVFPVAVEALQEQSKLLLETFRNVSEPRILESFQQALTMSAALASNEFSDQEVKLNGSTKEMQMLVQDFKRIVKTSTEDTRNTIKGALRSKMVQLMKSERDKHLFAVQLRHLDALISYFKISAERADTPENDRTTFLSLYQAALDIKRELDSLQTSEFTWLSATNDRLEAGNGQQLQRIITDAQNSEGFDVLPDVQHNPFNFPTVMDSPPKMQRLLNDQSPQTELWTTSDPVFLLLAGSAMQVVLNGARQAWRKISPTARSRVAAPTAALVLQGISMLGYSSYVVLKKDFSQAPMWMTPIMYHGVSVLIGLSLVPAMVGEGFFTSEADGDEYSKLLKYVAFGEKIKWINSDTSNIRNGVAVAGDLCSQETGSSQETWELITPKRLVSATVDNVDVGEIHMSECVQLEAIFEAAAMTLRARMVRLVDNRFLDTAYNSPNITHDRSMLYAVDSIKLSHLRICSRQFGLQLHGLFNNRKELARLSTRAYPGYLNQTISTQTQTLHAVTPPFFRENDASATFEDDDKDESPQIIEPYAIDLSTLSKSYVVDALLPSITKVRNFQKQRTPLKYDPIDRYGVYSSNMQTDKHAPDGFKRLHEQLSVLLSKMKETCKFEWPLEKNTSGSSDSFILDELCRSTLGDLYDTVLLKTGLTRIATLRETKVDSALSKVQRKFDDPERHVRCSVGLITHKSLDLAYNVNAATELNKAKAPVSQVARARMRKDLANGLYGLREVYTAMLFGFEDINDALSPLWRLVTQSDKLERSTLEKRAHALRSTYLTQAARLYGRVFVLRNEEARPLSSTKTAKPLEQGSVSLKNVDTNVKSERVGFLKRFLDSEEETLVSGMGGWSDLGYMLLHKQIDGISSRPDDVFDVLEAVVKVTNESGKQTCCNQLKKVVDALNEAPVDNTLSDMWTWYRVLLHDVNVLLPSSVWTNASLTP